EKGDKDKNSDLDKQLQEVRIQQFIKDLLVLIADIEKDANRGDLNSVQEKIAKIKEYVLLYPGWVDQEINERINKLEKRLQTMIITGPSNKNLITNSIILFIFLIILIYLLIIRWGINKIKTSKNY
ncbi:MAG: hypothetical protein LBR43_03985, partial [Spiroplasmataceae bacterium]|nr:hypothetical protein [Spiroplasmataceae bacterium]